jgi:hypothetical protein
MTATFRARPAGVNGQPQPIAFPQREQVEQLCRTRANADNDRWQQQVQRRDALILAAAAAGRQEGERAGYTQGWHWGAVCGVIAGGTAVGALWVLWAPLQAFVAGWLA